MKTTWIASTFTLCIAWFICGEAPAGVRPEIDAEKDFIRARGDFYEVVFSRTQPQFLRLAADSLGRGHFRPGELYKPAAPPRPTAARLDGATLEYRRADAPADAPARWSFNLDDKGITLVSRWSDDDEPEPVALDFDPRHCHPTLLGRIDAKGNVPAPAILHLPDQGTFRITAPASENTGGQATRGTRQFIGYDARRTGKNYVKVTFPPATREQPQKEYRLEVVSIYPRLKSIEGDRRFDGFRRNWLNILQLNPRLRMLANHSASDAVAFCFYENADIAAHTPPLAEGLVALDVMRESLDRVQAGDLTYGMPGYRFFDQGKLALHAEPSLDTYPSLLIAAGNCVRGGDEAWLRANYAAIRGWAETLLATDRDGNGLCEHHTSGNSDSWLEKNSTKAKVAASNWWDTIGFGHEDAYANALAYRGFNDMADMAQRLGKDADAARYREAAKKLHAAYFKTFYNPDTGVLAGWRSADGQLHDYYFLFVNGIAIHYGLVEREQANAIMDCLLAKMKEVGYTRFDLGLPGNLITVARKDYLRRDLSHGCGVKEDNSDGFQKYENGGATACFAYFTLAALYDLGRREEADRMLFPMLEAIEKGAFRGRDPITNRSYDWRDWNGTPWGYEGFLGDNYYVLLAVLVRDRMLNGN